MFVHVVYTFPFAFVIMLAIFNRFDRSVEEVAQNLGANPLTTFRRIPLPEIAPGILSAALFGFTLYLLVPAALFAVAGALVWAYVWVEAGQAVPNS